MASKLADLNAAREQLHALGAKGHKNLPCMVTYLRLVREVGVKEPEGVAEYGSAVLADFKSKLRQEELFQLYEDVAMAAAECGQVPQALRCAEALQKKFPASIRARVLRGLVYEAAGNPADADALYDLLLTEKPNNAVVMKRKVALLIGKNDVPGAVQALVAYLDVYQTDPAGWEQLCDLYIHLQLLDQARFCAEEVVMHNPRDLQALMRLADLLYAQGGASGFAPALGYYCKAVELSKGCSVRGLYGVMGCVAALAGTRRSAAGDHSDAAVLSAQKLLALYAKDAPGKVAAVRALCEAQQLDV